MVAITEDKRSQVLEEVSSIHAMYDKNWQVGGEFGDILIPTFVNDLTNSICSIIERMGMPGMFECPPGWYRLVAEIDATLKPIYGPDYRIDQIKEKFGGLRFYCAPPYIDTLLDLNDDQKESIRIAVSSYLSRALSRSYNICQVCGYSRATTRTDLGWVSTLCDEHYATRTTS